ncbi:dienelactone hydrolase family protein [Undibacterium amnicola]
MSQIPQSNAQLLHADQPHPLLEGFQVKMCSFIGSTKKVYVAGDGPAVIVLTEMPGISPQVIRFAKWVIDAGFTVYLPSLFGVDGAVPNAEDGAAILKRACVSAEFRAFASNESSPVTQWLRHLAKHAHQECGGIGVGAIGMCFTGNFALTMMLESAMLAPVLCQPSLPFDDPSAINMSDDELHAVAARLEKDDLSVLAYRFEGDRYCRAERFDAYSKTLGKRFVAKVLPDSAAHPHPPPFFEKIVACPHSVVTAHLIDELGQPTIAARDEILQFFISKLLPTTDATLPETAPVSSNHH